MTVKEFLAETLDSIREAGATWANFDLAVETRDGSVHVVSNVGDCATRIKFQFSFSDTDAPCE